MEEEMEMELPVFEAREIDLDYEFDAARFFDFTREESFPEAREAELWFESAPSYPPSPFVAKLVLREDILLKNVNTSPKSIVNTSLDNDSNSYVDPEFSQIEMSEGIFTNIHGGDLQKVWYKPLDLAKGLKFYDHMSSDKAKAKAKPVKTHTCRISTLMKPTTSQLAKQNRPAQVANSRFQMLPIQKGEKSLCNSFLVESQAPKRQKLEGGHLRKAADDKLQTNFVHKAPKKDGTFDKNSVQVKLKLTVPREPDLETAHRAQRTRPKNIAERENDTAAAHRFKARPLNRKILKAPTLPIPKKSAPKLPEFQEFHLKTLDRAMLHTSSVPSSVHYNSVSDKESNKPSTVSVAGHGNTDFGGTAHTLTGVISLNAPKKDVIMHSFKARPLNRKIFSSKGDIGIFRNSKRETTVPMEFSFQSGKRIQPNLPIDLFSKLSLTSELQPRNGSQLKLPQSTFMATKSSKENRLNSFQPECESGHLVKEKSSVFGGKQNQWCNDEVGTCLNARRSLGIR
ncbi:protein TPX2 isoform X2 [Mangifera indica]|uniref:protein TPX2 isoform X2 n=1 Tax=Mangifera indica TaxID=29780 RepID=UPI001CF981F3|nr:protein TPX2 isoform X2 [Mangifera indica]